MKAYYNEFDPFAAQWLRNLIAEGLITDGDVDERSIEEVQPDDLKGYCQCHFFAGIGGWSYALRLAGWSDDRPVWTGSCPCQPFSTAGKGLGERDSRHLWPQFYSLISQCRPAIVFGEQTVSKAGRKWLVGVRADLEAEGYVVGSADLCAACLNAPHARQRLYWVANSVFRGFEGGEWGQEQEGRFWEDWNAVPIGRPGAVAGLVEARARIKPGIEPLAHGIPARVGRLRGYGNAIVPQVAAEFIRASVEAIEDLTSG